MPKLLSRRKAKSPRGSLRDAACGAQLVERGQASVEAAFCIPLLFFGILLLIQPGIVLYDRVVMESAAAEACRALATSSDAHQIEELIRRRLGAVPQHECFHIHDGGCSWIIELSGGPASREARVRIANQLRPLPLIGLGGKALGLTDGAGNLQIEVTARQEIQPAWTGFTTAGSDPSAWVGAWLR